MTPAEMKKQHFAKLKANSTVRFPGCQTVWKVDQVVKRGAVLYRLDDGSHKHLEEWHKLALAIIE
jgi:hypothetical protein